MTSRALLLVLVLSVPLQAQNLDAVLKALLAGLNKMGSDVQTIGSDLAGLRTDVAGLKTDMARMAARVDKMEQSLNASSVNTTQLTQLQTGFSAISAGLHAAGRCCESNSKQRENQLTKVQDSLGVISLFLGTIKGLQRQTFETPLPTTPTRPTTSTPTPASSTAPSVSTTTTTPAQKPTTTSYLTPKPGMAVDCADVASRGMTSEGVHYIQPAGLAPIQAYCKDAWTVIQRRIRGDVTFNRPYANYQTGFGLPWGDHWLGLDTMHLLTSRHPCRMHAEFYLDDGARGHATHYWSHPSDGDGKKKFIEISHFAVGTPQSGYELGLSGLGTNLLHPTVKRFETEHGNASFSASDIGPRWLCAFSGQAAWWFTPSTSQCIYTNFNGYYKYTTSSNLFGKSTQFCSSDNKICAYVSPYHLRQVELRLRC